MLVLSYFSGLVGGLLLARWAISRKREQWRRASRLLKGEKVMLDLTPAEVVRLVQILRALPEGVVISNERDEFALLEDDEHTISLAEKINQLGKRDDVKAYIAKYYADVETEPDSAELESESDPNGKCE